MRFKFKQIPHSVFSEMVRGDDDEMTRPPTPISSSVKHTQ